MRQNLTLWEKALADILNQTVKFDESNLFLVEIDGQLINFHYQDTLLVIYACVGQLVDDKQAIELLKANCFWKGTKGATLSLLDEETIVLALQCSIQNKAQLNNRFIAFLSALSYWTQQQNNTDGKAVNQSPDNKVTNERAASKRWLTLDLL